MNKQYTKGARNEYKTMRLLEIAGYICLRTAGSHGPFDVIALSASNILLIQCKSNEWPTPAERETMSLVPVPDNCRKLVHRWDDRAVMPQVKEIT